jgi:hypothetical protein
MVTLFGTTYYTIGTGLLVLALLAPLLWGFARWALRPNVEGKPRRTRLLAEGGLTAGLLLLAAVGLYWDVYLIGQRAKELCEQTGLIVHRSVTTQSIAGITNIEAYVNHGLHFVEANLNGQFYRYEIRHNQVYREPIKSIISRYELMRVDEPRILSSKSIVNCCIKHIDRIVDRVTNEILGELVSITINVGWADKMFYGLSGFTYRPRTCGRTRDGSVTLDQDKVTHRDLVLSVIQNTYPGKDKDEHSRLLHERLVR